MLTHYSDSQEMLLGSHVKFMRRTSFIDLTFSVLLSSKQWSKWIIEKIPNMICVLHMLHKIYLFFSRSVCFCRNITDRFDWWRLPSKKTEKQPELLCFFWGNIKHLYHNVLETGADTLWSRQSWVAFHVSRLLYPCSRLSLLGLNAFKCQPPPGRRRRAVSDHYQLGHRSVGLQKRTAITPAS